jgi:hypothetical protein
MTYFIITNPFPSMIYGKIRVEIKEGVVWWSDGKTKKTLSSIG